MEYNEENHNDLGAQELARERGQRAEEVAQWYFRLNGFFLIPGFIVHPDAPRPTPRTEADLLGVRLSYSTEGVWRRQQGHNFRDGVVPISMKDHDVLTNSAKVGTVIRHLVAMVEVKAGICEINGPWSDRSGFNNRPEPTNMERALARVGFGNRTEVNAAAEKMFEDLRYEGSQFVVQYFAVGRTSSSTLKQAYPKLVQITFDEIGTFFGHRFSRFPEKIPGDRDIALWQGFGDKFRWWFEGNASSRRGPSEIDCQRAIRRYIDSGRCHVVV